MVPLLFNPPRNPLKGDPLYKVYIGLIIKGTAPRVPPFSLWHLWLLLLFPSEKFSTALLVEGLRHALNLEHHALFHRIMRAEHLRVTSNASLIFSKVALPQTVKLWYTPCHNTRRKPDRASCQWFFGNSRPWPSTHFLLFQGWGSSTLHWPPLVKDKFGFVLLNVSNHGLQLGRVVDVQKKCLQHWDTWATIYRCVSLDSPNLTTSERQNDPIVCLQADPSSIPVLV